MRYDSTLGELETEHIIWKQFGGQFEDPNELTQCTNEYRAFD